VKQSLSDLFKGEQNLILEEMMQRTDEHDEWVAFEGAYDECMHRIREHILLATGRDSNRLYGERRLNPRLQEATEQSKEKWLVFKKSEETWETSGTSYMQLHKDIRRRTKV
jgi:hypothetical protein